MTDIEISNGKKPKAKIDLSPLEWLIIGIFTSVIVWLLN